jgi:hypothetical protein
MREEKPESSTFRDAVASAPAGDRAALRRSFVITRETGELCARVLQRVGELGGPQPGGFVFSGERGVGKSHFLAFAAALLELPDAPEWDRVTPYLGTAARPRGPLATRFVRVPSDPAIDLAPELAAALELGGPAAASGEPSTPAALTARMAETAARWARSSTALLVLDDVSRRLERITSGAQLEQDLGQLRRLTGAFAHSGVLVILVLDGAAPGEARDPRIEKAVAALGGVCDFLWISRNNLADIVAAESEGVTRTASGGGGRPLEGAGAGPVSADPPRLESFRQLHPFHPQVYNALFQVRRIVPGFSPLEFCRSALRDRPARADLVRLDFLFDRLAGDLRESPVAAPVMATFDEVRSTVVPRLKGALQDRAEILLKGIALLTLCPREAASVRALTEGLGQVDTDGTRPSYGVTAAVLAELEQKGDRYLVVEGERFERSYRLLAAGSDTEIRRTEHPGAGDIVPHELPRLVSDWIHAHVPGWPTDASTRYLRTSQSIVAPLPSDGEGPSGMVYFKSIFDPLWSDGDVAAIGETGAAWAMLVLSPFERYYELDARLPELTRKLDRLLVWRPDPPAPVETQRLRNAAAALHDRATRAPAAATAEKLAWSNAQYQAEEVLWTLYVGRGRILGGGRDRRVADEIGTRTLSDYLGACLRELPWPTRAPAPHVNGPALKYARDWATLLADAPADASTERLEKAVLAAWHAIESRDLGRDLCALPDSFLTAEFSRHALAWQTWLETLQPLFARLRARDLGFTEAMSQVARGFGGDPDRLLAGKVLHDNLTSLLAWLPQFEQARDYVTGTFPTDNTETEQLRSNLLDRCAHPHTLLPPAARESFDRDFVEYRRRYIDFYYAMHEDALNIVGGNRGAEARIDVVALRNLEMLSRLYYTDKSYLNRVRIVGKWVQTNQCPLPVRQILESYPRCYCNFNPAGSKLTDSVAHLNRIIQEGVDYFRTILRRCDALIIQELRSGHIDDFNARQIASLLSRGPMIPLRPQSIDILNRIIQSHAADFVGAVRAFKHATDPSRPLRRPEGI